ncbi:MAG: hypothetical protein FWH53_08475 [Leptospirales bacterium]|nr:hypothetical protein [Leptospirales bacterium]
MKKFLLLVLTLMVMAPAASLFADHAKLMPENVGRVYIAPTYGSQTNVFNDDGDRKWAGNVPGQAVYEMWNIGLALEHGVTSWMTAALQWTPGYNIHSKVNRGGGEEATDLQDMGDLFVGAKIQLVGNTALLIPTDSIRFALAPGVKVPLTKGPDFTKESKKSATSDDYTVNKIDKHVLAAGWRAYFDYIFTKEFFINFYNETIFYVQKGKFKNMGFAAGSLVNNETAVDLKYGDVDYKYQLTFEIEPNYTWEFTPKTTIEFGLPISYVQTPAADVDLSSGNNFNYANWGMMPQAQVAGMMQLMGAAGTITGAKTAKVVTVKPTIGIFFMDWALPIEFKVGYFMPVWGKNANATNTFSSQIRVYYKI